MAEQFVHFVLLALILLAAGGMVMIFIWKQKRIEDHQAYSKVLNESSVKTCDTPESYAAAIKDREKSRQSKRL